MLGAALGLLLAVGCESGFGLVEFAGEVVGVAAVGVFEDLVGCEDGLEVLLGVGVGGDVGVEPLGQQEVGRTDFLWACLWREAEGMVVIWLHVRGQALLRGNYYLGWKI